MDLRRRALAVGLALCVLIGGSASADSASSVLKTSRYSTSVSLSSKFPAFSGRVNSDSGACRKHRQVVLFQKISGGDTKQLGKDTSDSSGRWAIQLDNVRSGAYYAKVKPKKKGGGGSSLVCKKGRSDTVIVN